MAEPAVAAQVHQTLDVDRHLAAQITFDREATDLVTQALEVGVGQILDLPVERHTTVHADFLCGGAADAIDRRQTDLCVLVRRNVDTSDACHGLPLICLSSGDVNQPWRCL